MAAAGYCTNFKNFDELSPSLRPFYSDFERNYDPVRMILFAKSQSLNVSILGPNTTLVEVSLLDCIHLCRSVFRLVLLWWENNERQGAF